MNYSFGIGGYDYQTVYHPVHTVVTPNAGLAVSLDEVKTHLGYDVSDTSNDVELTAFIKAAMNAVEQYCQITLLSTVFRADLPVLGLETALHKRPYTALTKIEYIRASDGEIVTIDPVTYHVIASHQLRARLYLGSGKEWPDDDAVRQDAFRITYSAGWTTDTLPADIKAALLQIVAKFDAGRGDCEDGAGGASTSVYAMKNANTTPFPNTAVGLLSPYKLADVWIV